MATKMIPKLIRFNPRAIGDIEAILLEEKSNLKFSAFVRVHMDKVVKNHKRKTQNAKSQSI